MMDCDKPIGGKNLRKVVNKKNGVERERERERTGRKERQGCENFS